MERLEIYLFLLGIISVTLVVLTFFVPLLLLGTYKKLREIKELLEQISKINSLSKRKGKEFSDNNGKN